MSSSSPQPPTSNPLLIALTGGIASGKSAVADLFAKLGVSVLDTDVIAREVVAPGMPALDQVVAEFGRDVLDESGALDRTKMRARVFSNASDRERLEAILHPAIRKELAAQAARAGGLYQVHVIPLLVETGRAREYDRVLVVDCPEQDQMRRLMARDGSTQDEAARIIATQASRKQRVDLADDVIVNTGTLSELEGFVRTLHKNYQTIAQARAADTES